MFLKHLSRVDPELGVKNTQCSRQYNLCRGPFKTNVIQLNEDII